MSHWIYKARDQWQRLDKARAVELQTNAVSAMCHVLMCSGKRNGEPPGSAPSRRPWESALSRGAHEMCTVQYSNWSCESSLFPDLRADFVYSAALGRRSPGVKRKAPRNLVGMGGRWTALIPCVGHGNIRMCGLVSVKRRRADQVTLLLFGSEMCRQGVLVWSCAKTILQGRTNVFLFFTFLFVII
jgi:hypothetical protein